jgi:hypothetical protein
MLEFIDCKIVPDVKMPVYSYLFRLKKWTQSLSIQRQCLLCRWIVGFTARLEVYYLTMTLRLNELRLAYWSRLPDSRHFIGF